MSDDGFHRDFENVVKGMLEEKIGVCCSGDIVDLVRLRLRQIDARIAASHCRLCRFDFRIERLRALLGLWGIRCARRGCWCVALWAVVTIVPSVLTKALRFMLRHDCEVER